jgi:hypothetical protein
MWYTWLQEKTYPPLIRVDPSYRYILLLGDVFAGRPAECGGGVGDAGTAFLVCLFHSRRMQFQASHYAAKPCKSSVAIQMLKG